MDAGAILDLEGAEQLSVLSPLPANTVRHPILVRLFQREDSIFVPTAQNPMNTALQPGLLLLDLSIAIIRLHDFDLALRALPQLREARLCRVLGVRATHRLLIGSRRTNGRARVNWLCAWRGSTSFGRGCQTAPAK